MRRKVLVCIILLLALIPTLGFKSISKENNLNKSSKVVLLDDKLEEIVEDDNDKSDAIKESEKEIEEVVDNEKEEVREEEKEEVKEEVRDHKEKKDKDKCDKIQYKVIYKNLWCKETHPKDYPHDAHYSTFVGIIHNKKACLWKEGGVASKGIRKLAETGKNGEIEKEIRKMKRVGTVSDKFFLKRVKECKEETCTVIGVCNEFPLVSIASMMGPSPDWFTGVSNISLCEQGQWCDKKIVMVYAYDAGTKEGCTYKEKGKQTKPQDKIMKIEKEPFLEKGELIPVGCFIFIKE